MNIGLLTPYYPDAQTTNSGLANHFAVLAQALDNLGHKVVIIHIRSAYEQDDVPVEQSLSKNINLLTYKVSLPAWLHKKLKNKWAVTDLLLKLKCMATAFKNINRIKKKYNLQVIETTSYFSLGYLYLFKKQQLPIVVRVSTTFLQMMDNYYPFKSRAQRELGELEIKMIKKSRFLITHAHDHAREIEKLYSVNASNFTIIPHGINLPVVAASIQKKDTEPLKILYVGRFEYRKGTDTLLQAIPLVLKTNPNVHFELIGSDPKNEYETGFKAQNSPQVFANVTFSGNASNEATNNAYAGCDIFVAPSRYESFGLIYIEAMSFGKPVIGCRVGGVPEIIEDNQNGLFAEMADPVNLAEKILILINNHQLRIDMGINARKTVEDKFTKEKLAENSVAYYKQALTLFKQA
ncbi:glycosyltransferase family 4 protein [Mucilaginibacter sp.]|uniref:glycosyltransferase family 4 protein n=1 Tax=Mucilaginibacter sp. TaxID=1882438 RepID=UPI003D0D6726